MIHNAWFPGWVMEKFVILSLRNRAKNGRPKFGCIKIHLSKAHNSTSKTSFTLVTLVRFIELGAIDSWENIFWSTNFQMFPCQCWSLRQVDLPRRPALTGNANVCMARRYTLFSHVHDIYGEYIITKFSEIMFYSSKNKIYQCKELTKAKTSSKNQR